MSGQMIVKGEGPGPEACAARPVRVDEESLVWVEKFLKLDQATRKRCNIALDILLSGFVAVEEHRYQALHAQDVSWCKNQKTYFDLELASFGRFQGWSGALSEGPEPPRRDGCLFSRRCAALKSA